MAAAIPEKIVESQACINTYYIACSKDTKFCLLSVTFQFSVICGFSLFVLTFLQSFSNLGGISRQVKVGVVGLQVAYGTVSPCHTEALDEQLCREDQSFIEHLMCIILNMWLCHSQHQILLKRKSQFQAVQMFPLGLTTSVGTGCGNSHHLSSGVLLWCVDHKKYPTITTISPCLSMGRRSVPYTGRRSTRRASQRKSTK